MAHISKGPASKFGHFLAIREVPGSSAMSPAFVLQSWIGPRKARLHLGVPNGITNSKPIVLKMMLNLYHGCTKGCGVEEYPGLDQPIEQISKKARIQHANKDIAKLEGAEHSGAKIYLPSLAKVAVELFQPISKTDEKENMTIDDDWENGVKSWVSTDEPNEGCTSQGDGNSKHTSDMMSLRERDLPQPSHPDLSQMSKGDLHGVIQLMKSETQKQNQTPKDVTEKSQDQGTKYADQPEVNNDARFFQSLQFPDAGKHNQLGNILEPIPKGSKGPASKLTVKGQKAAKPSSRNWVNEFLKENHNYYGILANHKDYEGSEEQFFSPEKGSRTHSRQLEVTSHGIKEGRLVLDGQCHDC